MLNFGLAKHYGVYIKRVNEAVRNNPQKFPERFSFKLTDKKYIETRGGKYKNPRVFTEQGVAMIISIKK